MDQARLTTLADLLVSQGRHEEALAVLKDLSARDSRNLRLLRLKLQAEQALRNWDEVLATVSALVKLGGLGPEEAATARRAAHLGNLNRKAQDRYALSATGRAGGDAVIKPSPQQRLDRHLHSAANAGRRRSRSRRSTRVDPKPGGAVRAGRAGECRRSAGREMVRVHARTRRVAGARQVCSARDVGRRKLHRGHPR